MDFVEKAEEKKELCSVASKMVSVRIVRRAPEESAPGEGEIVAFHCTDSSPSCETKCTYKLLMEDF